MAQKPENSFISSVHKYLPDPLHREKMANPYSSGTADVWYSGTKADLWIEYKFLSRIPQRVPIDAMTMLSPLQQRWLRDRHKEGRAVGVIIGCSKGGVLLRNLAWEEPVSPEEFSERLCSRKELAFQITQLTMR